MPIAKVRSSRRPACPKASATRPTAIARSASDVPTVMHAPPRRFCHAGWRDMPAAKRAKMKQTSARPTHTASCQPVAPPAEKGCGGSIAASAFRSPSSAESVRTVHVPAAASAPASARLAAGTRTRSIQSRRRVATMESAARSESKTVDAPRVARSSSASSDSSAASRCW